MGRKMNHYLQLYFLKGVNCFEPEWEAYSNKCYFFLVPENNRK